MLLPLPLHTSRPPLGYGHALAFVKENNAILASVLSSHFDFKRKGKSLSVCDEE